MNQPLMTSSLPASADGTVEEPGNCEAHGACVYVTLPSLFGEKPMRYKRCAGCTADRAAKEAMDKARKEREAHDGRVRELFGFAGIPRRFADRRLDTYRAESVGQRRALGVAQRFVDNWPEHRKQGTSLILTGGPGTGKTHLACGIASALIETYQASTLFLTVIEALRSIKATYNRDSARTEQDAVDDLLAPQLLVLDEIGVQVGSDHEKLLLFDVLNGRYQDCRPTILLSNLSGADLEQYLGQRVMDRYRECGAVIAFDWDSYRGRQ